ncbi:MAG: O-acetyl-ADP-ribose deacetylase [Proteobacteria bacterium]|nr:O-acetyl-ADP-ribose deacetylase [Pseudomonadota bacterium]
MSNVDHRIKIMLGDITRLEVDAIVNAANSALLGGGGVDGAIHRAAGPELLAECRTVGGANAGEAKITRGYRLPARHVIHTVGPIWRGGSKNEDALLEQCYRNSLARLVENNLETIAFPAISTGVYRFPLERATRIAFATVRDVLEHQSSIKQVTFCCFSEHDLHMYERIASESATAG